ncbi:LysM peptidoglycan-binding domain-containing protein [Nocardioides sp. LS1]|uniref:LysM peptidoglycan-binding domain-containing protein n=1 Tax=Nocardioides sp. LS1 TaxID=1027620 RepID=UPI000F61B68F|nr:LysM peptidoglycan-binding domain-containing protein [Nocardioides sp. LS1]GCD91478.1 hypothetical protein NLS1_34840 [Nocardioides sp. LS1]
MSTMTINPTFAPARPRSGEVRLTRRGRTVVLLAALLVVLTVGALLGGARSAATEHPGAPTSTRVVMVGTGDTLWDIASDLAPDGDVRAMIAQIEDLNALDSALVAAGQRLRVPIVD